MLKEQEVKGECPLQGLETEELPQVRDPHPYYSHPGQGLLPPLSHPLLACWCLPLAEINSWQGNLEN